MARPTAPLIFLHLPKTAGTTLGPVLQRHFPRKRTHFILSENIDANLAAFKAMPEAQRHRVQLLRGHQPFGLHEYLAPGARYLAVLREPVARVISHYHYVKSTGHPKFIGAIREANMSLADYAASGISGELENGQTRWIAGIWDDRPLVEADLERAIDNIEKHFDWVGLTERFDPSLVELAAKYRWLRVYYRKQNVSRQESRDVSAETLAAIAERNRLDSSLYQHVLQRFEQAGPMHRAARRAAAAGLALGNRLLVALR